MLAFVLCYDLVLFVFLVLVILLAFLSGVLLLPLCFLILSSMFWALVDIPVISIQNNPGACKEPRSSAEDHSSIHYTTTALRFPEPQ